MKKYQYFVAVVCILTAAIGFVGVSSISQNQKNREKQMQQEEMAKKQKAAKSEKKIQVEDVTARLKKQQEENAALNEDGLLKIEKNNIPKEEPVEKIVEPDTKKEKQETKPKEKEPPVEKVEATQKEILHFQPKKNVVWPVEGNVLLDYSMDATIYHPTLAQYEYNPAMVIAADVNTKVHFMAKGKITKIEENEETGCTVTQEIGDGYSVVYGQLKELNFREGDLVESGQVVGYITEPTKYYSVEGSNLYLKVLKDGKPVDPEEVLP